MRYAIVSYGERNAWEISHRVRALDLQKLGWHDTHVMPDLKPSMGDSTLRSVLVVAVAVSVGGRTISVSTKNR